jgi:hypothetical protein
MSYHIFICNTYKLLGLALVVNFNVWLSGPVDNFEGEVFEICLYFSILEFPSNQTLRVEDTIRTCQYKDRSNKR